jgi:hypothetical protein
MRHLVSALDPDAQGPPERDVGNHCSPRLCCFLLTAGYCIGLLALYFVILRIVRRAAKASRARRLDMTMAGCL